MIIPKPKTGRRPIQQCHCGARTTNWNHLEGLEWKCRMCHQVVLADAFGLIFAWSEKNHD
jgi:plasmid maintenance system killer protein